MIEFEGCDSTCYYCTSGSISNCLQCNSALNRQFLSSLSYGDQTSSCVCKFGTYENIKPNGTTCDGKLVSSSSLACNDLCWVCYDNTTTSCDVCSDLAFSYLGQECVTSCPAGMEPNQQYRACMPTDPLTSTLPLDQSNIGIYEIDPEHQDETYGCLVGEYFNFTLSNCTSCPD